MEQFFIGVDIGGTGVKTAIVDQNGKAVFAKNIATEPEKGFENTISLIATQIKTLISDQKLSIDQIGYIGMGIPGLTDGKAKVYIAHNINWLDVEIVAEMKIYFPDTKIYIANDASVAALAEYRFGDIQNTTNAVMITLGTGVGGGVIINKKLFSGSYGVATEIGHLIVGDNFYDCNCGNNGCLETFCSATALKKYAQRILKDCPSSKIMDDIGGDFDFINAKIIFNAYKDKDQVAQKIVKRFIKYLAIGMVNLINVYDPEVFTLGGGVSKSFDLFIDDLEKELNERLTFKNVPRAKIIKAKLGNDAGAIGASLLGQYM